MQLEKEFFAGQPLNSQVRQLRLLVIDFDETITTRDTSGTIAKTAIQAVVSKVGACVAHGLGSGHGDLMFARAGL